MSESDEDTALDRIEILGRLDRLEREIARYVAELERIRAVARRSPWQALLELRKGPADGDDDGTG